MSPSLEGIMFNRNANLSARRPLLPEPCRVQAVASPRVPPREQYRPIPAPRQDYAIDPFRPDYFKPSNVELEKRLQEARARDKIAYFQGKVTPPDLSLDRREAELVFRFDPHASAEYLSGQYKQPSVQFARPAVPANGLSPPRPPERDGPFVFGVHSPSQFPPAATDDYDYSEVSDDHGRAALRDDVSRDLNCCDKVNEWTVRSKTKKSKTLNRMFQIKDRRKVKCGKKDKIKCVLVGDGAVGKSSLIAAYAQNTFREDYIPTAYDTFNVVVEVDNRSVCVEICDTAGQDSMSELRALCYPGTDVLLLCFSLVRPETFKSVAEKWTKSVAGVRAPLLLIGTQSDLTTDPKVLQSLRARGESVVTENEAKALAAKINATYLETSAKTRKQLKDAFDAAILAGLPVVKGKKSFWKKLFCIHC